MGAVPYQRYSNPPEKAPLTTKPPVKLNGDDIASEVASMAKSGNPGTINDLYAVDPRVDHSVIDNAVNEAVQKGLITYDPQSGQLGFVKRDLDQRDPAPEGYFYTEEPERFRGAPPQEALQQPAKPPMSPKLQQQVHNAVSNCVMSGAKTPAQALDMMRGDFQMSQMIDSGKVTEADVAEAMKQIPQ
jgi:hypothetical protein